MFCVLNQKSLKESRIKSTDTRTLKHEMKRTSLRKNRHTINQNIKLNETYMVNNAFVI